MICDLTTRMEDKNDYFMVSRILLNLESNSFPYVVSRCLRKLFHLVSRGVRPPNVCVVRCREKAGLKSGLCLVHVLCLTTKLFA